MEDLFEKTLKLLDWHYILDRLSSYAGNEVARTRILALKFATQQITIDRLQDETTELRELLDSNIQIPLGGLRDVRVSLDSAEKGVLLPGRELLDIATLLEACDHLKRFLEQRAEECPRVSSVASRMNDLQALSRLLSTSFDTSGELSLAAYPALAQLRGKIQSLHGQVEAKLNRLLQSEQFVNLAQDQYVTMRGDRYVIPLKVQAKSMDIGIVHDASGSGQTVFVEPQAVIPLNNELKMAEAEYRREERRILSALTTKIALSAPQILQNLNLSAELEFIHARARLSQDLHASRPNVVSAAYLDLRNARHPVLALRGIQVVPNDLSIGKQYQALILSGPNTGGKTVALKTLGLCALMTRAGLHIPAEPGSEVGSFSTVLTDIGDQQAVEKDLSTFSGHITGIRAMLETVGDDASRVLILLDEIAVGTDPAQGAALARALLEAFVSRGAKLLVTTHYAELKTLSVADRRFANGRVEYDAVGLRPTYRVVVGTPGRSYALDIASKLGLPADIISQAQGYLAESERAMEDLLGELEQALSKTRDEEKLLSRARVEADELRQRYRVQMQQVEEEADALRRKSMVEFEREVRAAREEISGVVRAMQRGKGPQVITASTAREKVSEVARRVKAKAPSAPADTIRSLKPLPGNQMVVGARVFVKSLKRDGVIQSVPGSSRGQVEVEMGAGGLKVKLWPEDLFEPLGGAVTPSTPSWIGKKIKGGSKGKKRKGGRAGATGHESGGARAGGSGGTQASIEGLAARWGGRDTEQQSYGVRLSAPRGADSPEGTGDEDEGLTHAFQTSTNTLDLRGVRVDEGLDQVDRFLDKASLRGEAVVFVIHGHGTGAMKAGVRAYLKKSMYVSHYQPGAKGQGGDGATVIALS